MGEFVFNSLRLRREFKEIVGRSLLRNQFDDTSIRTQQIWDAATLREHPDAIVAGIPQKTPASASLDQLAPGLLISRD